MNYWPTIFAAAPFALFVYLLLWRKRSLLSSAGIMLATLTLLVMFGWRILPLPLWASYGKGFFVALDIFIIIFGAIFFLRILEGRQVISHISYYLESLSKDYRVQVLVIAWFFENFLEGTAGFGTPVAIGAPLLVGLGLPPLRALAIALLGNSASVVFGAAGTPIRVGFAGLAAAGEVPWLAAMINGVGLIVPIFMIWIASAGRPERWREFKEALPLALWSGIAFLLPALGTVWLGQELPSILGAVIGLGLVIATTRLSWLTPRRVVALREVDQQENSPTIIKAFLPYGLLIACLIVGKIWLGQSGTSFSLGFNHTFSWFNPGFAFLLAGLGTALVWRRTGASLGPAAQSAWRGAGGPFVVIICMSTAVQLLINSGLNLRGWPAAIKLLVVGFDTPLLPFFTPFIGAFGSFITGSATVSNIMFGQFFQTAALDLGLAAALILALGVVGASAGNMIALADMLAGQAVLGLKNAERAALKMVWLPCLVYLILVGLIGLLFSAAT